MRVFNYLMMLVSPILISIIQIDIMGIKSKKQQVSRFIWNILIINAIVCVFSTLRGIPVNFDNMSMSYRMKYICVGFLIGIVMLWIGSYRSKNKVESVEYMKDRNYGIELLRILSMVMIVTLHVLGNGGILEATRVLTIEYEFVWFLEILSYCAVNCYALISGYVGIRATYKYSSIVKLWLQVEFYTVLITALFSLITPDIVTKYDWLKSVFPVSYSHYWYFSSYFALFLFIPMLNFVINNMPQKELNRLIFGSIILFSVAQPILAGVIKKDIFSLNKGYSFLWLMLMYFVGGYIRKYIEVEKNSIKYVGRYFLAVLITWLTKLIIEYANVNCGSRISGNIFVAYTSPFIVYAGVCLLIYFTSLKIREKMIHVIGIFSTSAFSIYIIHGQTLIWHNILKERFVEYAQNGIVQMFFSIFTTVLSICIICVVIDKGRISFFRIMHISEWLKKLDKRIEICLK